MKDQLLRFLADEDGPTAVEYAVMLMLIMLAVIGTVLNLGSNLNDSLDNSNTEMTNAFS